MKYFFKILSVVLHPMFMPVIGLFLIFSFGDHHVYTPLPVRRIVYVTVFVTSCILPLSALPLLFIMKRVNSLAMKTRRERIWPMFITGMFFITGYYFLYSLTAVPELILKYIFATIITIFVSLAITIFWKISIHLTGIGGLTGGILALAYITGTDLHLVVSALFLAAGLLGTARIYLQEHNPAQVYAGFLLGFTIVFSLILF
ncbi:MAG: PAP2 family protein [Chlorobi bacterium]|nr:PAP2 family protein [Chlorobiota bacterium]